MAEGFVNLNRFKHGRTIKRRSKQRGDLRSSKSIRARKVTISGWKDGLNFGSIVVDGKQYHQDVLITADGNAKKRKVAFRRTAAAKSRNWNWKDLAVVSLNWRLSAQEEMTLPIWTRRHITLLSQSNVSFVSRHPVTGWSN